MNKDDKNNEVPLTDLDYEGVIYEPSKEAQSKFKKKIKNKVKPREIYPQKKIKKAQDFNFNIFIGITSVLGVVIFLVVVMMTYSYISPYIASPKPSQETTLDLQTTSSIFINPDTEANLVGVIKGIDYNLKTFDILNLKDEKTYTLKTKPATIFEDKYSNMLTIEEVQIGSIVDFAYDEDNKLNYIKENKNSFSIDEVSKVNLDLNLMTLGINDKTYGISPEYICLKDNLPYPIENISKLDILNLKGYGNQIYFIDIKKGNGTLKLINKPNFKNVIIEVDRDIFKPLAEVETLNLAEGNHKIVIRSDDTLPFVRDITIKSGEENILDLAQIQNKSGTLIVNSNVSEYKLYINNNETSTNEPINLSYGVYSIRAEKEGYHTFQKQVSIKSPQTNLDISFEKIQKIGKISITSNPDNAEVLVDNVFVGYTPINYKLEQGVHTVVIKKDGYKDFVLSSITVGDEESSFNITMHKDENQTSSTTQTTETTTQ